MSDVLLFGKMPSHGDFVSRGVDGCLRSALDEWLSSEMAAARTAFGDDFEDRFDSAPPWRFAWQDEGWTAGAIASSIDSAGRRFPLLVGRRSLAPDLVGATAEACEQAIYDAFGNGWSADELADAAAAGAPAIDDAEAPREGWWTLGGEEFPARSLPGRTPLGLLTTALDRPTKEAA